MTSNFANSAESRASCTSSINLSLCNCFSFSKRLNSLSYFASACFALKSAVSKSALFRSKDLSDDDVSPFETLDDDDTEEPADFELWWELERDLTDRCDEPRGPGEETSGFLMEISGGFSKFVKT